MRAGARDTVAEGLGSGDQPVELLTEILTGGPHVLAHAGDDLDGAFQELVLEGCRVVQLGEDLRGGRVGGERAGLVHDLGFYLDAQSRTLRTVEDDVHVASPDVVSPLP